MAVQREVYKGSYDEEQHTEVVRSQVQDTQIFPGYLTARLFFSHCFPKEGPCYFGY